MSLTLSAKDGSGDTYHMVGMIQVYLLRNAKTGAYVTVDAATMKQLTLDMGEVEKFLRQMTSRNGAHPKGAQTR